MSNTTSIQDLPVDPSGGSNENVTMNVTPNTNENVVVGNTPPTQGQLPIQMPPPGNAPAPGGQLDSANINSIVSGLQQASATGATQLPSRDIPITTSHISNDEQIQPNFIPQAETRDYIDDAEDEEHVMDAYTQKAAGEAQRDNAYDEFQTPFLLAILFFLFQLPFFKKYLMLYLPMLCVNDGNYNLYGYLFVSFMFAFVFYLLSKGLGWVNTHVA